MSLENAPTDKTPVQRHRWLIGVIGLSLFLAAAILIYWGLVGRFQVSTDDAYVHGNSVQVMSQISGYVTTIFADETQSVEKGQKLIALDEADAKIALGTAKAELALTARKVSQMYTDVAQFRAAVDVAKDNLEKVNQDLKRREGLVVNKTISAEELEHAQIAAKSAQDGLVLAQQKLVSALNLVGGTDLFQHPQIQASSVKLRNAYLNWLRTTIYSPVSGYVAKRAVQVGEQINANNILMIVVPLDKIWIDANFKESQLSDLRIGQKATVVCDAYGSKVTFEGTVVGLSPGTGSSFDLLPPQNATGNWIKIVQRLPVRIEIKESELKRHPLRIGLSATVNVNTKNKKGNSLTAVTPVNVLYESFNESEGLKAVDKLIDEILRANANESVSNKVNK